MRRLPLSRLARDVARGYFAHEGPLVAGALAYYAIFSFFPLLLIALAAASYLFPTASGAEVAALIGAFLPGSEELVANNVARVIALRHQVGLIGLATLAWSASGVFNALHQALNRIWECGETKVFWHRRLVALGMLPIAAFTLLASLAAMAVVRSVAVDTVRLFGLRVSSDPWLVEGLSYVLLPALTFVLFLFLYRFLPDVDHGWTEVWPGALAATAGFELARHGFGWYVATLDTSQAVYGSLQAALLFLLWLYVTGSITLIGAEVAAAWGRHRRCR